MVAKRRISKDKYIIAGVLTFLIFFLGLSLGVIIDNYRIQSVEYESKQQELDFTSLQFLYGYLGQIEDSTESCAVLRVALEGSVDRLADSLNEFLQFKEATRLNQKDYELAARNYLLDNLRYWFFAKQAKKTCEYELVPILYFYSGENCEECPNQGVILTYYKRLYQDRLLIFPIDIDLRDREPLIDLMEARYNVVNYPSIVVNDQRYEGIVQKEELGQIICDSFEDKSLCQS